MTQGNINISIRANHNNLIDAVQSATYATVRLLRALRYDPESRKARNKARYERMVKRGRQ